MFPNVLGRTRVMETKEDFNYKWIKFLRFDWLQLKLNDLNLLLNGLFDNPIKHLILNALSKNKLNLFNNYFSYYLKN